ncbi:AbiJ-NTD4 domain-containing protein [Acinetobacter wanghuae]|uniref:AbiJ-NTD4 domain-containing protein n=1 Tax=Acinetobacter wanghuae TaxID=2662362 RepID=UPI003AF4C567
MLFSEKERHKILVPLNDSLDTNLEFNLNIWNICYGLVFSLYRDPPLSNFPTTITGLKGFFISFYAKALIKPIDQIPTDINKAIKKLKKYMLQAKINEIYYLLEILSDNFPDIRNSYQYFEDEINKSLEKNASTYRLINRKITPITSNLEIQSIEDSIRKYTSIFRGSATLKASFTAHVRSAKS